MCFFGLSYKYKYHKQLESIRSICREIEAKTQPKHHSKHGARKPSFKTWCQEMGNIFTKTLSSFSQLGKYNKGIIGSRLFDAERTLTRSFKPGTSGQLCFSHTFVWIFTCYAGSTSEKFSDP